MSQVIQTPKVGELLTDAFGLKGRVRPSLEEYIVPTISLGDLSLSIAPGPVRHAAALINQAAVAAQRWVARFEAPPGVLCVIRQIAIRSSGGLTQLSAQYVGNVPTITPGTTCAKSFTDGRLLVGSGTTQTPSGILLSGTQVAALAAPVFQVSVPAEGLIYLPPGGWVVGGGAGASGYLEMQMPVVNITAFGGIEWDEYQVLV